MAQAHRIAEQGRVIYVKYLTHRLAVTPAGSIQQASRLAHRDAPSTIRKFDVTGVLNLCPLHFCLFTILAQSEAFPRRIPQFWEIRASKRGITPLVVCIFT